MATDDIHSPLELAAIEAAVKNNNITLAASENLRRWLQDARYSDYRAEVLAHIQDGKWKELDDAYWTVIPFGTGGRRGKMYPIGSNAINDRTIGESAQGVADYVLAMDPPVKNPSCAIAYDTRHKSRHFAELCAEILVGNGFTVYFLDGFRSTPELSFAVRYHKATVGIMVTASHNPPSDNAVKVYWSSGRKSCRRMIAGSSKEFSTRVISNARRSASPSKGESQVHASRSGRSVYQGGRCARPRRPARFEHPLHAAAWRRRVGRRAGVTCGRF